MPTIEFELMPAPGPGRMNAVAQDTWPDFAPDEWCEWFEGEPPAELRYLRRMWDESHAQSMGKRSRHNKLDCFVSLTDKWRGGR